ncbi:MAG: PEP-CTERM sorting domain-containing protein [Candidatus Acidiferrales bacterium]
MTSHFKWILAVAGLVFGLATAASASQVQTSTFNFDLSGLVAGGAGCGENAGCSLTLDNMSFSIGFGTDQRECQKYECGVIDSGSVSLSSPSFSMDGYFIPGSGSFNTQAGDLCGDGNMSIELVGSGEFMVTEFDGQSATGSGYASIGTSPACDANWNYLGDNVDFSIEFDSSPTPEPGTWLLLGTGMLALFGLVARKSRLPS